MEICLGSFLTNIRSRATDKESANCRMEANYSHQQKLDMIPLMLTEGFKPKGWLGLILGTRVWYGFWDADAEDDSAFEGRLDCVVREIGVRGKVMLPERCRRFASRRRNQRRLLRLQP